MLPSKLSFLAPLFAFPYGTQKGRMTFYSRPPGCTDDPQAAGKLVSAERLFSFHRKTRGSITKKAASS